MTPLLQPQSHTGQEARLRVNGAELVADPSGVAWWPERRCLFVADLHLEKGSALAGRGLLLPPYDSRTTLKRLQQVIDRLQPETVICLGDSFHDQDAARRLDPDDQQQLVALVSARQWVWIAGNHDPLPPGDLGGQVSEELVMGPLVLRHEALPLHPVTGVSQSAGELSGHFHPKAAVKLRARRYSGKCFISDGQRLILPSFGAYTGGLDVLDPAISGLFPKGFSVVLLGRDKVYAFPKKALRTIT
ncbi:ligase-associated DNA damage response endonuclease PdeM [Rhodovibrionaceae bacterium A322]